MAKLPISVFIIAKDEEDRIGHSIKSVRVFADEVIVIDSGSSDNTVAVAESLGARVLFNEWPGYVKQKIFGQSLCRNKWILNIDADEEISSELTQEIADLFKIGPVAKAYHLNIKILHRFDCKPHMFAPCNSPIRFYDIDYAGFNEDKDGYCHDAVLLKTGTDTTMVRTLKGLVYHRSGRSIAHLIEKANFYSTQQALELYSKGRTASIFRLIFELPLSFLKIYFLRRYFIYGLSGFVDSVIFAFAKFIRVAKLYELEKK